MIGIDEVGRGAWAGPLLIVAARQRNKLPKGLKDSKKLSRKGREKLIPLIENTCDIGEGWVLPKEIDKFGLTIATNMGVERALKNINAKAEEEIIMDGLVNYCPSSFINVKMEARADNNYKIVSAASIYAKVLRDSYMSSLSSSYKKYKFEKHVGYGTALHKALIELYGVSDLHRLSFEPIAKFASL